RPGGRDRYLRAMLHNHSAPGAGGRKSDAARQDGAAAAAVNRTAGVFFQIAEDAAESAEADGGETGAGANRGTRSSLWAGEPWRYVPLTKFLTSWFTFRKLKLCG